MSETNPEAASANEELNADLIGEALDGVSMEQVPAAEAPPVTEKRSTFQKKSSSTDLQSRLKSRKILGVGTTEDGLDIHCSKEMSETNPEAAAANKELNADLTGEALDGVSMEQVPAAVAPPVTEKRSTFQKKSSSADLQSRLKSRKVLGVGTTEDGLDIHRSKVSQILGHNEPMLAANREPIYWLLKWNGILSAILISSAIWSLLSPSSYSWIVFGGTHSINIFYSTCLFSMSLPLMSMSSRLVENNTQTLTLIALEISFVVHILGAFFGGAVKATFILLFLAIVNGSFLFITNIEAPKVLMSMVRRLSQSRESNIMSSSDKKNK